MKSVILVICLCWNIQLWASESCHDKKLDLIGYYGAKGEYPSEILNKWSEESGNLVKLEIHSQDQFSKAELVFIDQDKKIIRSIPLLLIKNTTSHFDFIKLINATKSRASILVMKIYSKDGKHYCSQTVALFKPDPQGGLKGKK